MSTLRTIRISTTSHTHQHNIHGVPFTVRVHSAVVSRLQPNARRNGRARCAVGTGETLAEAVAQAVQYWREAR